MSSEHVGRSRSFIIVLYNRDLEERGTFGVPLNIAAPFANRLLREVLPGREEVVREPWYVLIPKCVHEAPLRRAPEPAGPTALNSQRYVPEEQPPPRLSLHADAHYTHFLVRVFDLQTEIYQGEYSADDIFLALTEFLARDRIEKGKMSADEAPFYYTVAPSAKEVRTVSAELFPAEAYQVEGVFKLPLLDENRPRLVFHKMSSPPLPTRDPESYGATRTYGRGERGNGIVMMRDDVYRALHESLELSDSVENGGYLLGTPYRLPGGPESEDDEGFSWLVEITDVVRAEGAWGKPGLLLFTGETWSRLNRRRDRDYPDRKLVSWFHTHLFEATDSFGLSGLDQELHRRFLTKPWQVAVLVNINRSGERTVRCFQRGPEGDLVEGPFRVFESQAQETV